MAGKLASGGASKINASHAPIAVATSRVVARGTLEAARLLQG